MALIQLNNDLRAGNPFGVVKKGECSREGRAGIDSN